MALKVGHERLTAESGWKAIVPAKEGLRRTIAWYAEHPGRWVGRIDWSPTEATTR
jgi:dTDP-D-glucose 4,6-dehydratase